MQMRKVFSMHLEKANRSASESSLFMKINIVAAMFLKKCLRNDDVF